MNRAYVSMMITGALLMLVTPLLGALLLIAGLVLYVLNKPKH